MCYVNTATTHFDIEGLKLKEAGRLHQKCTSKGI